METVKDNAKRKSLDYIHWSFSERFGGNWVKVKFYRKTPDLKESKKLRDVRFCEAIKEAIISPVLLNKESITCLGASYAFGWDSDYRNKLLNHCQEKRQIERDILLKSLFSRAPHFRKPFQYIGLNSEGEPDLVMAYMLPEQVMNLIKIYNNNYGENLDFSLNCMMPICGGIAVRTYSMEEISFSFGCDDSRKYSSMSRERLAVGIPKRLFHLFIAH